MDAAVSLIVFLVSLHSGSASVYNRSGIPNCPGYGIGICVHECSSSYDCGRNQFCCSNGCGTVCMDALPDLNPKCPAIPQDQMGTCDHGCSSNKDCRKDKMCCSNGCGTGCVKHPLDDRCPAPDPTILESLPFIICPTSACSDESDCGNGKICCNNGCSNQCVDPPKFDDRCPVPVARPSTISCETQCSKNSDCRSDYICCELFCGGAHCLAKTHTCDPDQALVKCIDLCAGQTCPSNPGATCRVHGCDGCKLEFYDGQNRRVNECFPWMDNSSIDSRNRLQKSAHPFITVVYFLILLIHSPLTPS